MKETPILFNTEMVRALLSGRKTQTRRVIDPQPAILTDGNHFNWKDNIYLTKSDLLYLCPLGLLGDKLWVRETWLQTPDFAYAYKASHSDPETEEIRQDYLSVGAKWARWKPSIHMPKEAARLWLKITNVRVERLQDISEQDAIAEGIKYVIDDVFYHKPERMYKNYIADASGYGDPEHDFPSTYNPIYSFETLWDSIYKSWDVNPWVWVIDFEKEVRHG